MDGLQARQMAGQGSLVALDEAQGTAEMLTEDLEESADYKMETDLEMELEEVSRPEDLMTMAYPETEEPDFEALLTMGRESSVDSDPAEEGETKSTAPKRGEIDPTQLYLLEIGASPLLTADEEVHYARLSRQGDQKSRHVMIRSNLRLVVKIARRYLNRGLALLDLIEEGNLGLMRAVEKYDPDRGFRFSTYATWWIRQNIERAIMSQTKTIRLPIHIVKELNSYSKKSREMAQQLDHEPSFDEVAHAMNKNPHEMNSLLRLSEKTLSLDSPAAEDTEKPLLEALPDENVQDPAQELSEKNVRAHLHACLGALNEKQRSILARRFGLRGHEEATLEEVGVEVGLTRERVRQIQVEALKILKGVLKERGVGSELLFSN